MKAHRHLTCLLGISLLSFSGCREEKPPTKTVQPLAPMPKDSDSATTAPPPPADLDAAIAGQPQAESAPEVRFIVAGAPAAMGGEGAGTRKNPGVASTGPDGDLARLTQALRSFVETQKYVPKTLEELVAAGTIPNLPAPPAGKKFAIDDVQLEVKLK